MLIALVAAYPLCRRFYKAYTLFIAPVLCAVLLGAIIVFTGSLGDIDDWFFFTYKTNIRAFAEISMGATAFEISRRMQGRVYPAAVRILLSLTALTCLSLSIAYMCSAMEGRLRIGVFIFYLSGCDCLQRRNSATRAVSAIPLFISGQDQPSRNVTQTLLRRSVPWYFAGSSQWTQCILIYLGIFGLAVFLDSASAFMHRHPVLQPLAKRQTQHT